MTKIYELYIDCIVVTAESSYPLSNELRHKVIQAMSDDETLNIVVLGVDSMRRFKIATKKILILDDILLADFDRTKPEQFQFDMNEYKISLLIKSFFDQNKKIKLGNSISYEYNNLTRYGTYEHWIKDMLSGCNKP